METKAPRGLRDEVAIVVGLVLLMAASLACNAFAGRPDGLLPPPPAVSPTVEGVGPESGEGPGLAATVTLPGTTPIPANLPQVRILVDLNIRNGPGVEFRRAGFLLAGETAPVLGRDEATGWWQIVCPPAADGPECWVSGGSQYTRLEEAPATREP